MISQAQYYSLADFEKLMYDGFTFQLSNETKNIISLLEKEIKIPEVENHTRGKYSNTWTGEKRQECQPINRNKNESRNAKQGNKEQITNEDWSTVRNFKTTKIEVKEGIDKKCSDIRSLLNKISNKNFETQKVLILNSIRECLNEDTEITQDDKHKIAKMVFDVVSNNKFFSNLYTELFKELSTQFDIFQKIFEDSIVEFKNSINTIHYIDPNTDYDGYCGYIKINDSRRASSAFIVNMCKNGVVELDVVIDIMEEFLKKTLEYIDLENKTNEVEEITENIFVLVSMSQDILESSVRWKEGILTTLHQISKMKTKEHSSLTTRMVFKYMDIIDSIV
jgi:hypothetical protein